MVCIYDLNNIKLRLGLHVYKVSMTNLIQQLTKFMTGMVSRTVKGIYDQLNTTFYGIYDQIYDWQLRLGLYNVSMTNLIQQLTKFMTGMVYNSDKYIESEVQSSQVKRYK